MNTKESRVKITALNLFLLFVLSLISTASHADYFGIKPYDKESDVKKVFPNAKFKDSKPAWLKSSQRFVDISGDGIDGELSVVYKHELIEAKEALADFKNKENKRITLSEIEKYVKPSFEKTIVEFKKHPKREAWQIEEIRWAPPAPIPLIKFTTKYGEPTRDSPRDDMKLVKEWDNKYRIFAFISSYNQIDLVFYRFSTYDYFCASLKNYSGKECSEGQFDKFQSMPETKEK